MVYASAGLTSVLIYDRARILEGQYWRLLTANLVHFEGRHLVYDLSAFGVLGTLLESLNRRRFGLLLLVMSVAIGLFLVTVKTDLAYYGGLSALAYGSGYYLALVGTGWSRPWNRLVWPVLLLLPLKLLLESRGLLLLASFSSVKPVWESHAVGLVTALVYFCLLKSSAKAGWSGIKAGGNPV